MKIEKRRVTWGGCATKSTSCPKNSHALSIDQLRFEREEHRETELGWLREKDVLRERHFDMLRQVNLLKQQNSLSTSRSQSVAGENDKETVVEDARRSTGRRRGNRSRIDEESMAETEEEGRDDATKGDGGTKDTSSDEDRQRGAVALKKKKKKEKIEGVVGERRKKRAGAGGVYASNPLDGHAQASAV